MHALVRRTGVALAAAALLAGAAACGSDGGSDGGSGKSSGKSSDGSADKAAGSGRSGGKDDLTAGNSVPIAALKAVEKKTRGASSSKFESTMVMGSAMTTKNEGALDWSNGAIGHATVTYTSGTMATSIKAMDDDGTLKARYLPDAYYAGVDGAFQTKFPGKHWIRYDYDDLSKFMGPSGDYMKDQMQNSTPSQAVKLLLASKDVKRIGTEDVRGVRTTHYAGTVDVADMARRSSKTLTAEQLSDLEKQLKATGVAKEQVDIWVDAGDLMIKRKEYGKTASGAFAMTAYYSDYGTKVTVRRPAPAESIDFTELQGS